MKTSEEMEKYRSLLDEAGIPWIDKSDDEIFQVSRTHFFTKKEICISVIQGEYTYGGDKGLLEVMINDSEPDEGWLTAEEVVSLIEDYFNKSLKEIGKEIR